jgi:hypothetical protein
VKVLSASDLPGAGDGPGGLEFISIAPPPPRPACRFIEGEPEQMARELVRVLREEAKVV